MMAMGNRPSVNRATSVLATTLVNASDWRFNLLRFVVHQAAGTIGCVGFLGLFASVIGLNRVRPLLSIRLMFEEERSIGTEVVDAADRDCCP